jgi:hypothetical protein
LRKLPTSKPNTSGKATISPRSRRAGRARDAAYHTEKKAGSSARAPAGSSVVRMAYSRAAAS